MDIQTLRNIFPNEKLCESDVQHFRYVFGQPMLSFVETVVINLPEPCYANCSYCIDKEIKNHTTTASNFLKVCEKTLNEFPTVKFIAITGGSLKPKDFNTLLNMCRRINPNAFISWNTNGIHVDKEYSESIKKIDCINLHRNGITDEENIKDFKTNKHVLTLSEAKELFGDKLFLRVIANESFDLDEYANLGINLYINRLLPPTKTTQEKFNEVVYKIDKDSVEHKRHNVYVNSTYKNVKVRLCVGDTVAVNNHYENKKAIWLNVAIIHRSGIVCGSWFENDKIIYKPDFYKE